MKKENNNNFLQNIWKIHTDVQEQMLQLRSVPVRVIPQSTKIAGDKLLMKIDENDKIDKFLESLATIFNIDPEYINLNNGYINVDKDQSRQISFDQKKELARKASANFIEFLPNPIIDGYINKIKSPISDLKDVMDSFEFDYDFDRNGRLQISINDLMKLNTDSYKNIAIPDKASLIIPIEPNPVYFLKKRFPNLPVIHKTKSLKSKKDQEIKWYKTIEVSGSRLKKEFVQRLDNDFGLTLIGYDYIFYVNRNVVDKYNPKESPSWRAFATRAQIHCP